MSGEDTRAAGGSAAERAYTALVRFCRAERFHPGEQIGNERALAERLGVGRTVLRQAIDRLEQEGTVRRAIGRTGGLFFHDGRIQRHLNTVEGVPDMVLHQGRSVSTRVLRAEVGVPEPDERRRLALDAGAVVVRVRRLRLVDGVSWSLDHSTLPASRFPGLLSRDLTGSLYRVLGSVYELELDHADETIEAVPATAEQSAVLAVPEGSALLSIWRVAWDVEGTPVEYAHDLFRADRTRVHLQKYGTNWKRTVRLGRDESR
ncbi:GntR family transcriptional regulator [Myceligenerans indicum]|uniref:GntR family transcriptional regulator n=1 Tax=Myceligenerans indicum TaxID=2593663 RepID=A0ABS1LLK5_9MICO|nr:GntR family transcriptional regulator [Myceligenerans indicum]MBL0887114.1 GntR family transcriptional regulator [Myceligenerans indicum]